LFNSLVEEDYHDPCVYGGNVDEKLDLHVDGDNDKTINHHFKDLDPQELENLKASGCWHNIHYKIWVANAFNAWQKSKKLDTSLSIVDLHAFEPKLLVSYLSIFL
jgi:hypothetical protein